jgi:hypothetical protein
LCSEVYLSTNVFLNIPVVVFMFLKEAT